MNDEKRKAQIIVDIDVATGTININTGDVGIAMILGIAQMLTELGNQKLREEINKTVPRDKVSVNP